MKWAILIATGCVIGLGLAILVREKTKWRRWPAKLFRVLAIAFLILGLVTVLVAGIFGTAAEAAIVLFFVLGFAGYLSMLSEILMENTNAKFFAGKGLLLVFVLGSWSWASALAMRAHLGMSEEATSPCILVPTSKGYDTELDSVWQMRLPQIVASRTGPTGTVLLDYHAILVAQTAETSEIYNWSKTRLRFDILDQKRNPSLPKVCP
ncbi:hypothetical protein BVC71_13415 [Marivivens niveibacter]|uniref:Uncharacterized protein n=1 Tax=Marivivens niveibacter TaxID=1930667 RepID=A0A251WX01_9RHOB|nr:hypothetical protein BVC71_13415 [Marivivens niveibacter]